MATLTGSIVDLVGDPATFPNGSSARAFLHPPFPFTTSEGDVRIGGLELVLTNGSFNQTGVPAGNYQIEVLHYDGTGPTATTFPVTA